MGVNRLFAVIALTVVGACSIAGCGLAPTGTPAPITTATTSAPAPAAQPGVITEQANHTTLRLHTGQVIRLDLHSLYWSDPVSVPTGVLVQDGPVSRVPDRRCPMGVGCGTLTVRLHAAGSGTTQLQAHRSSCGEAMGCSVDQRDFTVTVVVS